VGVPEKVSGQADTISGLTALDDHTLQVTLDAPKPYFVYKLTYPTSFIVDRENVESGDDWYREPNGTGSYRMREWRSFEYIIYEANADFYLGAPSIRYIVVRLYSGVGLNLYETGEIDITGIGRYDADRFLEPSEPLHSELLTGVDLCTSYITFDVTQPPFDDVNVRKAFSMAFDRQKYLAVVLNGHALPANGLESIQIWRTRGPAAHCVHGCRHRQLCWAGRGCDGRDVGTESRRDDYCGKP
jgi:ABC-type oligopeptide transport system substrate-binding subunit